MKNYLIFIIATVIILNSCSVNNNKKNKLFNVRNFNIDSLSIDNLIYSDSYERKLNSFLKNCDKDSIPLFKFGDSLYFHPVLLAQKGIYLINSYRLTKKKIYLSLAIKIIHKLVEKADTVSNSLLYPYPFDFPLHGRDDDIMIAPWYSSMAQGQILQLIVRAYNYSHDTVLLNYAKKTFNSFLLLKGKSDPWISCIDDDNYLWFEEYPKEIPNYTLNGFAFAVLGIYEYYELTKDKTVKLYLEASLTTLYDQIELFRNVGGYSYYCKKHKVENEGYHNVHIKLFKFLYRITKNDYFLKIRSDFLMDKDSMNIKKENIVK